MISVDAPILSPGVVALTGPCHEMRTQRQMVGERRKIFSTVRERTETSCSRADPPLAARSSEAFPLPLTRNLTSARFP
jgi:hypothetical protein